VADEKDPKKAKKSKRPPRANVKALASLSRDRRSATAPNSGPSDLYTPEQWALAKKIYSFGVRPMADIAKHTGISFSALKMAISRDKDGKEWVKSRRNEVEQEVKRKVQESARNGNQLPKTIEGQVLSREDKELDAVTDFSVQVVIGHRKELDRLGATIKLLHDRLDAWLHGNPTKVKMTDEDGNVQWVEAPFMSNKESPTDVLEKLSRMYDRKIARERQTYGLEDKKTEDPVTVVFSKDFEDV
jgi:hypothetical protein